MVLLDFMLVAIIVLAVALVAIILVQAQDAGLGSMFGGDPPSTARAGAWKRWSST